MEYINGKSMDIVEENIKKLKDIFPQIFEEGEVSIEKFQDLIGKYKSLETERYNFTWPGKSKAIRIAQTPSTGTLRPCKAESKDWDTTQNLYIEGDNLEVLKLLQKSYYGKVKMIYIDPPYNTGNDFVYKDDFKDNIENYLEITGQKDTEGNKITTNTESSGRYHSNWLNMMYPRLKLARNLLDNEGIIFISIDDNEFANLKKVCDEIFGEDNFYGEFVWQRRSGAMDSDDGISCDHEYIIAYGKLKSKLKGKERTFENYSNPDNDPRGPWTTGDLSAGKAGGDVLYEIIDPKTGWRFMPPKGRYWPYNRETMKSKIEEGRIIFPKSETGRPALKRFKNEAKNLYMPVSTLMKNYNDKNITSNSLVSALNTYGTSEMRTLFGNKVFNFTKPSIVIESLISQINTNEDFIILDFFGGSSTTAHAVMEYNMKNNTNNKFIIVQIPEQTEVNSEAYKEGYTNICEIGKERIRRAGNRIIEKESEKNSLDIGFKVFKLNSSNIKKWDFSYNQDLENNILIGIENIKTDRDEEDILYEVLLKYGIDLNMPIEEHNISGKKVFDIGFGAIIACLDNDITLDVVEGIGKLKEELNPDICRVVFMDNGFITDSIKTNAVQILKRYDIEDVKCI